MALPESIAEVLAAAAVLLLSPGTGARPGSALRILDPIGVA